MVVYRVEEPVSGIGFYRFDCAYALYAHASAADHPLPEEDSMELGDLFNRDHKIYSKYFFAFASIEDAYNWIFLNFKCEKGLKLFFDAVKIDGVKISAYEVDEKYVVKGSVQCVFKRSKAKLIHSSPLVKLKNGTLPKIYK